MLLICFSKVRNKTVSKTSQEIKGNSWVEIVRVERQQKHSAGAVKENEKNVTPI